MPLEGPALQCLGPGDRKLLMASAVKGSKGAFGAKGSLPKGVEERHDEDEGKVRRLIRHFTGAGLPAGQAWRAGNTRSALPDAFRPPSGVREGEGR